jgi:hypothetical protein
VIGVAGGTGTSVEVIGPFERGEGGNAGKRPGEVPMVGSSLEIECEYFQKERVTCNSG